MTKAIGNLCIATVWKLKYTYFKITLNSLKQNEANKVFSLVYFEFENLLKLNKSFLGLEIAVIGSRFSYIWRKIV